MRDIFENKILKFKHFFSYKPLFQTYFTRSHSYFPYLKSKDNTFVFFILVHFHLMFKTFFRFICWINIQVIYGVGGGGGQPFTTPLVGPFVITHSALYYYEGFFSIL